MQRMGSRSILCLDLRERKTKSLCMKHFIKTQTYSSTILYFLSFLQNTDELVSPPISPIPLASDNGEVNPQHLQVLTTRLNNKQSLPNNVVGKCQMYTTIFNIVCHETLSRKLTMVI